MLAGCGAAERVSLLRAEDLPALVARPPRTPAGVIFRTVSSRRIALDDLVAGAARRDRSRRLRAAGFVRAFEATFRSDAGPRGPRDALGAAATAVLFADEPGARRAVAIIAESERELGPLGGDGIVAVPASSLGREAWGFRVSLLAGDAVFYGWHERNVVLLAAMGGRAGAFAEEDAHAYADAVEARARTR